MDEKFEEILKSDGGPFIRKLLEYEKKRVDKFNIEIKKREPNIFEQMNIDFGIFPEEVCYPVYFHGDLMKPKNKIVIIGINPGKESTNEEKCEYCEYLNEEKGLFEQYCNIFINCFKDKPKKDMQYFYNIYKFFSTFKKEKTEFSTILKNVNFINDKKEIIPDWEWFQENIINLEIIPYHSKNVNGLNINNLEHYKKRYLEPLLKIINHIKPKLPILINGYPTSRQHFESEILGKFFVKEKELIYFKGKGKQKDKTITVGKIDDYKFYGLPFLSHFSAKYFNSIAKAISKNYEKI